MAAPQVGDRFHVLTALLLTPGQFPSVLGDDYPAACAALALEPWADGYGLLLGQTPDGARRTVVCDDAALVGSAVAAWDCGVEYRLQAPDRTLIESVAGWPLALRGGVPHLPEPFDPPEEPGRPFLRAPDPQAWGPAQRRLGADDVAKHWLLWREKVAAGAQLDPDAPQPPQVQRILRESRGYTADPPPAGRVRSAPAPDGARMVRADGPGWSLAAHTDDIALVLTDDLPHEVTPIPRTPELPSLLRALDLMARTSH
ncbi:hypothetical protein [Streptacidiphilus monticola]|uniref:ESAT-6 protein secretion system EspG family protein n=1 Tax=Streptacidiphilus monticola TaxID=2161674 RepID=A0ABW1FUY8_9ACTN